MRMILKVMMVAQLALAGGWARAEDSRCVALYKAAHEEYVKVLEDLKTEQSAAFYGGSILGGAAYGACVWRLRSYLGCGALLGGGVALGAAYSYQSKQRVRLIEESNQVYELYEIAKKGGVAEVAADDESRIAQLGQTTPDVKTESLFKIPQLMESGELCPNGHPMSVEDVVAKLEAEPVAKVQR